MFYLAAQSRAENVKIILAADLGIPSERFEEKAYGSLKQPYKEMVNNRVVLAVVLYEIEKSNRTQLIGKNLVD